MPDRLSSDRDQVLDDSIERRHCERQMTLIAVQVHPCIRNVFGEPLSVREGHHPILLALPHRHRWLDLREVESPVAHKRQIVVTPTRDAIRDGVPEGGGQEVGEDARQRALVDVRYQTAQGRANLRPLDFHICPHSILKKRGERRLSLHCEAVLLEVARGHTGHPVQSIDTVWCDAGQGYGCGAAVWQ